jgi:hypothetical protein
MNCAKSIPFLLAGLLTVFCENPPLPPSSDTGAANITAKIGRVGTLSKRADISFAKLCIALSANGEISVFDTIPISGNGANTVSKTYESLAALKTWTLTVNTLDSQDSIIHSGLTTFDIRPRQTTNVSIDLPSRFSMLKANFSPIRDSVTRCELLIDGIKTDDSSFAKQSAIGKSIQLAYDYMPTGQAKRIKMDVYGDMWNSNILLYTGDTLVTAIAGANQYYTIVLKWKGPKAPPTGQATMTAVLGAIGTVVVNGVIEDIGDYVVIGFDTFPDGSEVANGTIITNQYARLGVVFSMEDPTARPVAINNCDGPPISVPNALMNNYDPLCNPTLTIRATFVLNDGVTQGITSNARFSYISDAIGLGRLEAYDVNGNLLANSISTNVGIEALSVSAPNIAYVLIYPDHDVIVDNFTFSPVSPVNP